MAKCDNCSKTILFGGKKLDGLRFCNDECLELGYLQIEARAIPDDIVFEAARELHMGLCPVCSGNGPIDVHTSHEVWSLFIMTSWKSLPRLSCRSCGVKRQVGGLLFSTIAGWWGFPWGLFMTPLQISKNIGGLAKPPDPLQPSDEMLSMVRLNIAENLILDEQEKAED
jgi:hypothetical protein